MSELGTTLSIVDLYDILEVISVDAHNARVLRRRNQRKR